MIDISIMPFATLLGVRLLDDSPDLVVAEMVVRPDLCTAGRILHGGAVMAFADSVGAVATVLNLPPRARTTTIESKTNFIGAVREGEVARAKCRPIHKGKTTMVWRTDILQQDGKLAASVTQTQLVLYGSG